MFSLIQILGSSAPNLDILDIGAMIEGAPRYASIYDPDDNNLTLVEPNKKEANNLKKIFSKNIRILEEYLGDGNSWQYYTTQYPGCSSLYEPDPEMINQFQSIGTEPNSNFSVIDKSTVQTVRLDNLLPSVAADLIKIDVQGAELVILDNAKKILRDTCVIETEVEFVQLYKKQPLFGDLQVFLKVMGFSFHKFIDVGSRCFRPMSFHDNQFSGMSQMLWADAIFVRDFSRFDNYTNDQLLKTAFIMHDVYSSFDFTYRLLNEFDSRNDTRYTHSYVKKLLLNQPLPRFMLNFKETI